MHTSRLSLGECPVVLLHGQPGYGFTGQGYPGVMTRPPCRIVVTSDGNGESRQHATDLAEHLDDAIRELAIDASTVRCSRRLNGPSDCGVLMPQDSIKVLAIVGDRNSPMLCECSDLGRLCKSWTQLANSYIVPVAEEGTDINRWLPPSLVKLNASFWSGNDFFEVVHDVLYVAGLDPCRRVFISYRRKECSELSEQLFEELSKNKYDVFLDRFCVPPARDFQKKLTEDLADKSLVLVLESPKIMKSKWVQYEINFAKINRLGILAIRPPNVKHESQVTGIEDPFRIDLCSCDFVNSKCCEFIDSRLTDQGLRKVIRRVMTEARLAYLKRLFELNTGLIFWLDKHGITAYYDPNGIVLAQNNRTYGLWTTPMSPTSIDFHSASTLGNKIQDRCIVSPAQSYVGQETRTVTEWLSALSSVSLYTPSQILDLVTKIQGGQDL